MQALAPSSPRVRGNTAPFLALFVFVWCAACGTDRGSTEISQDTRRWVSSRTDAAAFEKPVSQPEAPTSDQQD